MTALAHRHEGTWLGRPGVSLTTSKGTGQRWVLHRWTDDGATSLRLIKGDGRTRDFLTIAEHDLGTTDSIEAAVAAATTVMQEQNR